MISCKEYYAAHGALSQLAQSAYDPQLRIVRVCWFSCAKSPPRGDGTGFHINWKQNESPEKALTTILFTSCGAG